MKVVAIGGEPGSGKTKLMRHIISRLTPRSADPFVYQKILHGALYPDGRAFVLGRYDGPLETFAGTDRLSMAVQPVAESWLREVVEIPEVSDCTIYFEGDRLFNLGFLTLCQKLAECRLIVLIASQESLWKRHKFRGDKQTDRWLQGRATKIMNLVNSQLNIRMMNHETEADTERVVNFLIRKEEKTTPETIEPASRCFRCDLTERKNDEPARCLNPNDCLLEKHGAVCHCELCRPELIDAGASDEFLNRPV